jgi:hypothetical protein
VREAPGPGICRTSRQTRPLLESWNRPSSDPLVQTPQGLSRSALHGRVFPVPRTCRSTARWWLSPRTVAQLLPRARRGRSGVSCPPVATRSPAAKSTDSRRGRRTCPTRRRRSLPLARSEWTIRSGSMPLQVAAGRWVYDHIVPVCLEFIADSSRIHRGFIADGYPRGRDATEINNQNSKEGKKGQS